MISAAVLDALVASGATAEMIAAAVKADLAIEEARVFARREKAKLRQRRLRMSRSVTRTNAMSRDVTQTPPSPREVSPPAPPLPEIPLTPLSPPIVPPCPKNAAWDRFRDAYPKRSGSQRWEDARKRFEAAIKAGEDPEAIISGAAGYSAAMQKADRIGTEFVMQAATWMGQKAWREFQPQAPPEETVLIQKNCPEFLKLKARWVSEGRPPFSDRLVDKWPFPAEWIRTPKLELVHG